jgi:hypothetical protein
MPTESDENHPTSFRLGPLAGRLKQAAEESGVSQITIAEIALTQILDRYDRDGISAFDRRQLRAPAPQQPSAGDDAARVIKHSNTTAAAKKPTRAGRKALQGK